MSLNRPPVSCLQSRSAGVLKTHTLSHIHTHTHTHTHTKTQFKPTCAAFLRVLRACRIKPIVALKRAISWRFIISRETTGWEIVTHIQMVHLRFALYLNI